MLYMLFIIMGESKKMKKECQTEDDRIIEGCKKSIKKLDEEKERIYEMTKNLTEIIGRMENIKKDKEQSKEDYLKGNRQFEKLYELIKYATGMNWRLIEGGKVKPFTPESASQKRGFEDSTVILKEERDTEKMSAKEMEEELHERRKEIYAKMEKEVEELEQEIAIPGIPTKDSVAFREPVKELQTYKGRLVNPDVYKVVEGKLYFKKPHENCGGDISIIECRGGWDHGHAKCTKCGKTLGGWISGADNMPFYG